MKREEKGGEGRVMMEKKGEKEKGRERGGGGRVEEGGGREGEEGEREDRGKYYKSLLANLSTLCFASLAIFCYSL